MFEFGRNKTFDVLSAAMDGLEKRHKVLSNNVANMNTPGFNARGLDFGRVMEDLNSMITAPDEDIVPQQTTFGHLGTALDRVNDAWDNAIFTTAAAPDLQDQMVQLNMNSLQYSAVTQALSQQLYRYRHVLFEGRR